MRSKLLALLLLAAACTQTDQLRACDDVCKNMGIREFKPSSTTSKMVCTCNSLGDLCGARKESK